MEEEGGVGFLLSQLFRKSEGEACCHRVLGLCHSVVGPTSVE